MKVLVTDENKRFFYKEKDLHTKWGYIRKEEIEKANPGEKLLTNKGKELYVFEADFTDIFSKIKRGAQVMLPKDIASIIVNCGINKNSRVADAGTGSGGFSCMMATIAKQVYSYEIREDHANIARTNIENADLKNIKIKVKDVCQGIDEKNLDLVSLDLARPWEAIDAAHKSLKPGGFIVNYSPNLTQTKRFVSEIQDKFLYLKTCETIEREWEVEELKLRPKYRMLGHTGFLTFAKKIA
ncbi:MAG: tRNA (adenine-N1)-methyltransferase [Nanobdellota archaeon]